LNRTAGWWAMASSTTRATTSVPGGPKPARLTRYRVVTLGVVSLLAFLAGVSVWRMRDLGDLPNVGDPFDLALARQPVVIADSDNAYEAYARARLTPSQPPAAVTDATWNARQGKDTLKWSTAQPEVRSVLICMRSPPAGFCAGHPTNASTPECCAALRTTRWLPTRCRRHFRKRSRTTT
jgi:hypothetical protein